jgi:hypothetical protein
MKRRKSERWRGLGSLRRLFIMGCESEKEKKAEN